ncbi:S41 family peptidase [Sphingomonas sp. SM33]|uniref:S41 family peptidase n=1 Tax=Sphingomonas telluris TaxID=2907998 RepID=A0ABS9VJV3_9SPHN|nr:S41 family peptidase [Sphingomonas telluris]MCH8614988.1 S41 family peptidase [Sphingomonas telluris]
MKYVTLMIGAATLGISAASNAAQPAPAPVASATQVDAKAVVADVRRIIAANYVLADVRPKLDAALAKGLEAGRYNVSDPGDLAARLNEDMTAVAHDKHLGIHYDPREQASLAARPPGAGDDDAPPSPEELHQATQFNHGILQLKVLPGNIRYMETLGFFWGGKPTAEAYDNAIRFLRDGDAIIIDLRRNGGGSPDAVQYLISHFLKPSTPIVTFYMGANKVDKLSSLPNLPAGRLIGKPLYVLTSGNSASAAEEFIGHVAGFKLGEIIGENTAGAGFRNSFFPVTGGYVISVSVGRAVLASTGKDWEGVGIAPTTQVDVDKALEVAQVHALKRIARTATGEDKRVLEARAAVLDAQLNPVATALPLNDYAGAYGERSVSLTNGKLFWQRGNGPKIAMVAIAPNEFSFEDDPVTHVKFNVAGNAVTGLELLRGDGSRVAASRNR